MDVQHGPGDLSDGAQAHDLALELRQPSPRVSARIWTRHPARHGIESNEDYANALAREFAVSPGVVAGAAVGARFAEDGGIVAMRRGVHSLSRFESYVREDYAEGVYG